MQHGGSVNFVRDGEKMKLSNHEKQQCLAADRDILSSMEAGYIRLRIQALESELHNPEADVSFVQARLSLARQALKHGSR